MDEGGVRPRRGRIVAAALFAVLLLAIAVVWSQRKPIARDYVDRSLAARGVRGSYRITELGVTHQRLENVVLGDPAAPDLTAASVDLELSLGFGVPTVRSITAQGVRLRGRLVDGKLSLGTVDRLLPAPSAGPFALPDLHVDLSDARMRLETPWGAAGLALTGRGNLSDGFTGRLAAVSHGLDLGGCKAEAATAWFYVAIADRRPKLDGPVRAKRLTCGSGGAAQELNIALDAVGSAALDRWRGKAGLRIAAVQQGARSLRDISGRMAFSQGPAGVGGDVAITAGALSAAPLDRGRLAVNGRWRIDRIMRFAGEIGLKDAALAPDVLRAALPAPAVADTSPIGPLWRQAYAAVLAGGRRADVSAQALIVSGKGGGGVRITRATAATASGVALSFGAGAATYYWPSGKIRLHGDLALGGGGLPAGRVRLRQDQAGGRVSGQAIVAPYGAGGARLSLAPVRFAPGGRGITRFDTVVTMDGPVAGGRVAGLRVPVRGWLGRGGFAVGEGCVPLDFTRLEAAGLTLGAARLPLCASGGALVASSGGVLRGGATILRPRLTGHIGRSPATIAAARLAVTLGQPGFTATGLAVGIGEGESLTRLAITDLGGQASGGGIGGRFAGTAGNIGSVPLLLSDGRGEWRLASGVLTLAGHLRIADRAAAIRFHPLESDDVRLRLEGGQIAASGSLVEPGTRTRISDVTLAHDLSTGTGNAHLAVPGILFSEALQPEALTPLTLGVVANIRGIVSGRGDIRWTPDGATSDGDFRTDAIGLAAAFGPVTGLKGAIHFSDLLALATPPGQVVTLAEVNPGVAVTGGVVRYQLLPGQQVRVEGGRWPFSGGEMLLDPTLLDFGQPRDRTMTFRIVGLDAAQFIQQFQLKNIALTGTFDGVLPMVFGAQGGRIVGGRLAVRRGGGTLAYVGEVSNADLGMFAKLAFDALKSMRYDALAIELDGALDGELISRVLFNGTNESPKSKRGGMLAQLTGLPFRFNITIRAPFRGLLNSAQSLNDPRALIGQAMPRAAPTTPTVQPKESETVP
jgi:translocation and assembly module TamB